MDFIGIVGFTMFLKDYVVKNAVISSTNVIICHVYYYWVLQIH